jgi:hypothetical protein
MKVIRYGLQTIGKFAELRLKLAVFISTFDVLPAVVEYNMIIS